MSTQLYSHIQQTPLYDTHEHANKENKWLDEGPDILQDLFGNYVPADLVCAGASPEAMQRLTDATDPDLGARFAGIRDAWDAIQFTGYGEAVRILGEQVYGMQDWSVSELEAAQEKLRNWRRPGGRYHLLREVANLDHIQVDDFSWSCLPDASGPDFFLYDLSWAGFCNGQIDVEAIHRETGITVSTLSTLRQAMEKIFDKYGPLAIAVKAQHAYFRTLAWQERTDYEAAPALQTVLSQGDETPEATRLCLGDWCWAQGVELATQHNLPFKIHTGYYAGNHRMPVDRIKGGNLCALLARYPDCRFVLMHIAYPYSDELVALAKHYCNVWADLCWAWSIDPYSSCDFVRRFIHAVPANKLFAFGGDTGWPTSVTAYAIQARKWLNRALQSEVDEGLMNERQAMDLATRLMSLNQEACFDLQGTRAAIQNASIA